MAQSILGIIGEIAAGKTTATEYLKQNYGAVTFRFSDVLRDITRRLHLPETRENLQRLSTLLRQNFGEDLLSKVLAEDVKAAAHPLVVVEGIRRPSDTTYLKELPGFKLVYLKADPKARWQRLTARSENPDDRSKTWEQFQAEGQQESEQKIKEIAAAAAVVIDNNGALEKLYHQIDQLVQLS